MNPIALAVLLTVVPSDPPVVENAFPVAVTAVQLAGPQGATQTLARIPAGRTVRARGVDRIVSFEMESCPREARDAFSDGIERGACWRALVRSSHALAAAPDTATVDLQAVLLQPGPAEQPDLVRSAQLALPELVSIVVEGGTLGAEVEQTLARLGMATPALQLRQVPRTRRPELLTVLSRHEDGRAFGLLVRAALESSVEAERHAAVRGLVDYPEDAVQRLSNALEDASPLIREHAADALHAQDARAIDSLRGALLALGVTAREGAGVAALADELIAAHVHQLGLHTRALEAQALAAIERRDRATASQALAQLEATDRAAYGSIRTLRARQHLIAADEALAEPGEIEERGRTAAQELASAQGLDPRVPGLEDVALRLGRFLLREGYPASASRVLGPYEVRDARVAALRDRALRDEVRRRVEAGDEAGARARLMQLVQEGRSDLADALDDEYGIRAGGVWLAPASLGMMLCACIGWAVRRERRRRRHEFQLIETESDLLHVHHGPYR